MADDFEKFDAWLAERELPPNLKSEMDYYMNEVDRDYTLTLREAIDDWEARHEAEPKAGWLNRQDIRFIREGYIACGIAKPLDRLEDWQVTLSRKDRTWFTMNGVAYEYAPNES